MKHPLRVLIHHFDGWLSRVEGVVPFSDAPQCILRIQTGRTSAALSLPDALIPAGAPVVYLHLWNERVPSIPKCGPDLAWARRTQRLMIASLKLAARHIQQNPSLHNIRAVGGMTVHASLEQAGGGRALFERLGFTVMPYHRPLGAFGEFWENFYTWWLMWTYNPVSVRHRRLWDLQRTEFWMSAHRFIERFASPSGR